VSAAVTASGRSSSIAARQMCPQTRPERTAENLVSILAADIVAVFLTRAPDVDLVALGLTIANEGRRLEEQRMQA
jgi:hypothetical protein